MPRRPRPKIPPELLNRILRSLIWKVGLESLQNPDKELSRRIQEGWKRFVWDVEVRAARTELEQLAGLPSVDELLAAIPFELPDLRKSKPVLSRIKLKANYNAALTQAQVVFRRPRSGVRLDTPIAGLRAVFPDVPRDRFEACKTARDAAIEVVRFRFADHLASATVGHLVDSKPGSGKAAMHLERRAADLDPALTTAIRRALTKRDHLREIFSLKP